MKAKHKAAIGRAKLSLAKMAGDLKDPAAIIGGMVIGKFGSDLLDKAIGTTSTVSGLKGINSIGQVIKPLILIGGGLAARTLLKNPIVKNAALGVAAYGGAVAISSVVSIPGLSTTTTQVALPPATTGTSGMGTLFTGRKTFASPVRLPKSTIK